jgi:hypothetical protein
MPFSAELAVFEEKLKLLDPILVELFKQKKPLGLTIRNCSFKKGRVVISHIEIPVLDLLEEDLDNPEGIKRVLASKIEKEKRDKEVYDLQFQIRYWEHQLSPEFTARKQVEVEKWKASLSTLEGSNVDLKA